MSWDIFALAFPSEYKSVDDVPRDFKPGPIGPHAWVVERIKEAVPTVEFQDSSWALVRGDDWSIEINVGKEEVCESVALLVRGGDGAIGAVAAILQSLGVRGVDTQTGDFFAPGPAALESFRRWREFRDYVGTKK